METIHDQLEFAKLAGLVDLLCEPDVRQSEQERLLQALRKLRRQSTRGHQGLSTSEERPRAGRQPVVIIRNSVRWRLRTLELPCLLAQLARLAQAINPATVADQPQAQFCTAVRLLSEMESSVDQITSSAGSATSDTPAGAGEEEEEMTLHRGVQVVSRCKSVLIQLSRMLGGYERFFRVLVVGEDGRVSPGSQPVDYLQEFRKESVPRVASEVMQWIRDGLLPWLALSSMRFLHHEWLSLQTAASELQAELAALPINTLLQAPTIPLHPPANNKKATSLRNQLVIALIPLTKLARLFLNKLCQSCSSNGPLLLHLMSVQHQEELRVATKSISCALHDIFNTRDSPQPHLLTLSLDLIGALRNSTTTIQSIFLQHSQSLPSSSSSSSSFPSSDHGDDPKLWLQLWLQQFSLATNNFLRTSERHADHENYLDIYHA
ncbi:hypothetical protein VP01_33g10 [Puccinia sorghi]|uniref:Uncharacterized protein n=1 Tax=Puccinia sorghi TaxID=27349 RepID=A0A0L6UXI3_9BASI|nr:hypothetical protein VP01_33g10 [Puccinia sorghi]